ncbi:MAG: ATP-binding protein [Gemmatimonadota bacterium]
MAVAYLLFGLLWISYSDAAVESLASDPDTLTRLQNWKGWFFVCVTAVAVYFLVRGALSAERKLSRSLGEAEARLRLVLDTIPSRVLWKDRHSRYLGGNLRFAKDAGLADPAELVGLSDTDLLWGGDAARLQESDRKIVSGEVTHLEYELIIPSPEGQPRHVQVTKVPLPGPDGEIAGVLASYEDNTAQRLAERQLHHAQKLRAIGELTSGVTHDFKNVLSVIIANGELVARTLPVDSEEAVAMSDLLAASQGAVGMVRKLLGFSREGDLVFGAVDLRPVVRDLAPMLSRLLAGQHQLEVAIPQELPLIFADPDAVEQMLLNLITNARDAMPDGGAIRLELFGPGDGWDEDLSARVLGTEDEVLVGNVVTVRVSDTGCGMSPDVAERVLEPFFSTKPIGQGTGLGLSMVYGLMRQHGGYVTLRTAPGKGASFGLHFPVLTEDAPLRERRRRPQVVQLARGSETILLVDDQEELRRTGSRVLRRYGYTVLEATNGAEALAIWRERRSEIALVLTDYIMPEMHGLNLVRELRAIDPRVCVALSSGHADVMDAAGNESSTAVPMIAKPWSLEELVTGVRDVLDGRR